MDGKFLNSTAWERLALALSLSPLRINNLLFVKQKLRWGQFYLASRFCLPSQKYLSFAKAVKQRLLQGERALFVQLEPLKNDCLWNLNSPICQKLGLSCDKSPVSIQPKRTVVLKLTPDSLMFSQMHPKTRYNIRLAQNKNLQLAREGKVGRTLDDFWSLAQETAKRQNFRYHSFAHYRAMLKELHPLNCQVWAVYYHKVPLSAMITVDDDNTRYYLHGASSGNYKNLMAPYLLHWRAISDARKSGLKYYDFWGVAPLERAEDRKWRANNPHHPWAGITRFKLGFAPRDLIYRSYGSPVNLNSGKLLYKLYKLKHGKSKI